MEIKNSGSTRPFQDIVCTGNGDFGQESRTFTCTFCKRGFSNAQALGGHMNVHRKDRARLQESIQDPRITKEPEKGLDQGEAQSSSDEKGDGVPKRPWTSGEADIPASPRKKDHAGANFKKPTLELSLCIESPSTSDSCIRSNKVSSLSSSSTEVDLELRLGMDSEATSRDRD